MISKPRVVDALYSLGPAPSLIAAKLRSTVPAVREAIANDEGLREIYVLREQEILSAIRMFGINIGGITQYLNCTRSQYSAWVQDNAKIRLAHEEARMEIVDVAETQLLAALARGSQWAVKMVLESEMGSTRGYGQRRAVDVHLEASRLGHDATALRDRLVAAIIEQAGESGFEDGTRLLEGDDMDILVDDVTPPETDSDPEEWDVPQTE